jgi:hypothetical protein
MPYCRWGCFLNQCRVVVRVKEFVRVKVIVRVEVIPYRLGFPLSESKLYWTFQYSESVIGSIMSNWYYTTMLGFSNLPIFPTEFLSTNPYVWPHNETLLMQPLWDLALRIPPDRWISIRHSMVFTDMRVEGPETITTGVLLRVQPDPSTGAQQATAHDSTWGWTK